MWYRSVIKPIAFALDAERAHDVAFCGLRLLESAGPVCKCLRAAHSEPSAGLASEHWGLKFANPVGLAAGFDKNAEALRALAGFGFGYLECGTITALAQAGNPKPRLLRLPECEALINRMGFNNQGSEAVAERLRRQALPGVPLGINIGKSKVTPLEKAADDYVASFERLYPFAGYFAVNVSSPNTPRLRELQADLGPLLTALQNKNVELSRARGLPPKPILVKIAPDLDAPAIEAIGQVALESGMSGIIATNTTVSRDGISMKDPMEGGLSGRPLFARSTEVLRQLYCAVGKKLVLIGVGGISSAEDAYVKIRAGASLVQIYTAWIYQGPGFIKEMNRGLARLLARDGFEHISQAVGADAA